MRERGGYDLMPELDYRPVNKYLPPRPRVATAPVDDLTVAADAPAGLLKWVDRLLSR